LKLLPPEGVEEASFFAPPRCALGGANAQREVSWPLTPSGGNNLNDASLYPPPLEEGN